MPCEHPSVDVVPRFTEASESVYAYVGVCAECGATGPDAPTVDGAAAAFFAVYPFAPQMLSDVPRRREEE